MIRTLIAAVFLFFFVASMVFGEARQPLSYAVVRTPAEQSSDVDRALRESPALTPADRSDPLRLIEDAVRGAQRGEPNFRFPVDDNGLLDLQAKLQQAMGRGIALSDLEPMVDRAHVFLRESRGNKTLTEKVAADLLVDRPNLQGEMAELRLARAIRRQTGQEMVLTKDPQSPTFDLTEAKVNPRSGQLKVYKDPLLGLRKLQADLENLPKRARYGWLPNDQVEQLVTEGHLSPHEKPGLGPNIYTPTRGPRITVQEATGIESHSSSVEYAERGKKGLALLAEPLEPWVAPLTTAGEVFGGALLTYEAANEWTEFYHDVDGRGMVPRSWLLAGRATSTSLTASSMMASAATSLGWESAAGKLVGRAALPLYLASATFEEGIAVYDYHSGQTGRGEFIVRSAGPMTGFATVGAGAAVGAGIGVWFGGVGAGPGALIGAGWGLIVAIPTSFAAEHAADSWYAGLNDSQRQQVETFVRDHYGLN